MGRTSESSDASSTYSDTTVCSYTKEALPTTKPRKGVRQRVRDVVADLGTPPTARVDAKEGTQPKNHVEVGPIGTVLMGATTV
ncbi:Fc.00g067820.m01.CDS01 [Cosmosporella sp. VM-42]